MEGDTLRREEDPSKQMEPVIQLTRSELRRLMEKAGQNALVQHERRTVTPLVREAPRRRLFKEREVEKEQLEETSREEPEKGCQTYPNMMAQKILRNTSPHFSWYLYGQSSVINAKLFVATLTGKAQEWFTSLPSGGIETFDQLIQKFTFHFASKRKQKRSATYLFNIRQGEGESLKNFIGRFNNETLEVQDLKIDMIVSILIHGLKKGPLASALARDPPEDVEQLMKIA
ncbi:UNVERIFIED_CONTAM: hypothetical protein Sradi_4028900 [Sesamum radiatum]|uniref:Retrotransposon gag domain-containing protein n=1 Tax=Sesamum radiatum TaxID=300843 RepID=A0AAW2PI22_SESRA